MNRVPLLTGWPWLWHWLWLMGFACPTQAAGAEVGPVPAEVRQHLSLSPFYVTHPDH